MFLAFWAYINTCISGTLYIRRRSQLLRETEKSLDNWKQYLHVRSQLLQQRYGSSLELSTASGYLPRTTSKVLANFILTICNTFLIF